MTDTDQKREIEKVKWDGSVMQIHYSITRDDGGSDEYTLRCRDQPRPEFEQAMNALIPHIGEWLEINDEHWVQGLKPRGVSFTHHPELGLGAVVTALRDLDKCNSPVTINTPNNFEEPSFEDGPCLDGNCVDALKEVIEEANAYIDGYRAQLSLYETEEETAQAA